MIIYSLRRTTGSAQGAAACQHYLAKAWRPHAVPGRKGFASSDAPADQAKPGALRILFCGSDEFSCESLKALHAEQQRNKALVDSVEVMVLTGKRMGRGFKKVAKVPCKTLADDLGLKIHEKTTFREWALPGHINLVVAVSFGLFVPARILSSAKYGGLNVHPSLLPHLRGPAPVHHAYLRGDQYTGVSLQTLDPKAFDHGTILAQTPAPGMPISPDQSFQELKHDLAVRGAEMLVQGLRDGVHVPPHKSVVVEAAAAALEREGLVHAPKMTKAEMEINWAVWTVEDMLKRISVFETVWTRGIVSSGKDAGAAKRVLFVKARSVATDDVPQNQEEHVIKFLTSDGSEKAMKVNVDTKSGTCYFQDDSGAWIGVERAKLEGSKEKGAVTSLRTFFQDSS